ncbi:MAG: hypothetical protein L6M37_07300 [Candidatus Methylarchaceae archaeon HK02M1]|nr:hypothetical protein [Candidatus Methylarchaceae archaeon HK02M1]
MSYSQVLIIFFLGYSLRSGIYLLGMREKMSYKEQIFDLLYSDRFKDA